MSTGLIHIYTGDGKGKTTAAVGMAVRAKSRGLRVLFVQFFKETDSGSETTMLDSINIKTVNYSDVKSPFFNQDMDKSVIRKNALMALSQLKKILSNDNFDLIVLDEFICLISEGIITDDEAITFFRGKPKNIEIILTGKGATERMIEIADYVTFMKNIKHPYDKKMSARKGIEF